MRTSFKRLFAAILPLTGLLLTAPLATTAHADKDHHRHWRRHHRYDYAYRHRDWRRYGYHDPYYNRRWGTAERYSYYRPDPYWYAHKRHHHDD